MNKLTEKIRQKEHCRIKLLQYQGQIESHVQLSHHHPKSLKDLAV